MDEETKETIAAFGRDLGKIKNELGNLRNELGDLKKRCADPTKLYCPEEGAFPVHVTEIKWGKAEELLGDLKSLLVPKPSDGSSTGPIEKLSQALRRIDLKPVDDGPLEKEGEQEARRLENSTLGDRT